MSEDPVVAFAASGPKLKVADGAPMEGGLDPAVVIPRLAGLGLDIKMIAAATGIPVNILNRDYREAMDRGIAQANIRVVNALWSTAQDRQHRGHTTAAIYWTKARMGWAETAAVPAQPAPGGDADAGETPIDHLADEAAVERFEATLSALKGRPRRSPGKDGKGGA